MSEKQDIGNEELRKAIGERLGQLAEALRLKIGEFSEQIEASAPQVSSLVNGTPGRYLSYGLLIKIANRYPEVNLNWLVKGEGDIFTRKTTRGVEEPRSDYGPPSGSGALSGFEALLVGIHGQLGRLHRAGALPNLRGVQFYSLKDTLAIYLLDNSVDVESAMRHFRHRSLEMFQRYVKRLGRVNEKIRALPVVE